MEQSDSKEIARMRARYKSSMTVQNPLVALVLAGCLSLFAIAYGLFTVLYLMYFV